MKPPEKPQTEEQIIKTIVRGKEIIQRVKILRKPKKARAA